MLRSIIAPFVRPVITAVITAIIASSLMLGCTNQNRPLNDPTTPLELRRKNHTLATTGANVSPMNADRYARAVTPDATKFSQRRNDLHDREAGDPRDDGCFVGLALSGGGSRSANFSAACMFQLQRVGLLQRIDYISSVSGGSLPAALYCLSDDHEWNPQSAQRKLTHAFASDVITQAFLPWNDFALAFTDFDRTDLLAASFAHNLFTRAGKELRFADLRADRPRLLINATDLQSAKAFVFCDESFDQLNSDLAKFPIAYAVAASAAVPVVMHQVTLRDYSTIFKQYRHLIDGGVNDNLGITTLVDTFESQSESALKAGLPDPYPNGGVFFVCDARTQFDAHLDDKGDIGLWQSLAASASVTSTALLNRVSSATLAEIIVRYSPDTVTAKELRAQIDTLNRDGFLQLKDQRGHPITVVHLALSDVAALSNLPSQGFFQRLNDIATFFNITDSEAASLYLAADLLMKEKFESRLNEVRTQLDSFKAKSN